MQYDVGVLEFEEMTPLADPKLMSTTLPKLVGGTRKSQALDGVAFTSTQRMFMNLTSLSPESRNNRM